MKALLIDLEDRRRDNLREQLSLHQVRVRAYAQVWLEGALLEMEQTLAHALSEIQEDEVLLIHDSDRQEYSRDLVRRLNGQQANLIVRYGGSRRSRKYKGGRIWDLPWAMPTNAKIDWHLPAFIRAVDQQRSPQTCFDVLQNGSLERREWQGLLDELQFPKSYPWQEDPAQRFPNLFALPALSNLWQKWLPKTEENPPHTDAKQYRKLLQEFKEQSQPLIQ